MGKTIMKLACSFNRWLLNNLGVLSATKDYFGKNVHLTADKFFEMFDEYERIENYSGTHDKLYVKDGDTVFFTLAEREV